MTWSMKRWCRRTKAPAAGGPASGWRRSGPRYLDLAFHAARDADPDALLVYNDYGCEQGAPANDRFRKPHAGTAGRALEARRAGPGAGACRAISPPSAPRWISESCAPSWPKSRRAGSPSWSPNWMWMTKAGPRDIAVRDRAVADEAAPLPGCGAGQSRHPDGPDLGPVATAISTRPSPGACKLSGWRDRRLPYDAALRPKPLRAALAQAFPRPPGPVKAD